jgi:hypothetical protein
MSPGQAPTHDNAPTTAKATTKATVKTAAKATATTGEFQTFLARYHTDVTLKKLHYSRLMLGLGGAVLSLAYNALRLDPSYVAAAIVIQVATVVAGVHIVACLLTLFIARWRFIRDFRSHRDSLRDRAWQVAQYLQRRGAVLLVLAATGHILIVIATHFRLHLFQSDGDVLLVVLIPTFLLIIHGLFEIPTRARMERLYRSLE